MIRVESGGGGPGERREEVSRRERSGEEGEPLEGRRVGVSVLRVVNGVVYEVGDGVAQDE